MLDAKLRPFVEPPLDRLAGAIARTGVGANVLTGAGFVIGLLAVPLLATEQYRLALAAIVLNRVFDGLDGAVARRLGPTDLGGYLDIVFDFLFYSAVAFGFALARPENALPAAFLVWSFVGTGTSFLAFAIFAAKHGIETKARGPKAIYYLGGLTEGTETIAAFVAFAIFPDRFPELATAFGALCWVTTASRIAVARHLLSGR